MRCGIDLPQSELLVSGQLRSCPCSVLSADPMQCRCTQVWFVQRSCKQYPWAGLRWSYGCVIRIRGSYWPWSKCSRCVHPSSGLAVWWHRSIWLMPLYSETVHAVSRPFHGVSFCIWQEGFPAWKTMSQFCSHCSSRSRSCCSCSWS